MNLSPPSAPLVRLAGVGKDYAKLETKTANVKLVLDLMRGKKATRSFRALHAIDLVVNAGESVGIIGENGAGKSTLLKVVAGVVAPTRGTVETHGRIGALLELGAGFHPEYSGLANIDLAAALLGLSAREIAARREEIIAFADLGEHLRKPIKHYSSGMIVRLGFAVASTLAPDLLITDEVLAVGDESFQKKCTAWIEAYLQGGGTLLLCTHSMHHINKLCRRALWLKDGQVQGDGESADVTRAYLEYHERKSVAIKRPPGAAADAPLTGGFYALRSVVLRPGDVVACETSFAVSGEIYSPDGRAPVVLIGLVRADGTPVYGVSTDMDDQPPTKVGPDRYAFEIEFPQLALLPGAYFVRSHVLDPEGLRMFDTVEKPLTVTGEAGDSGLARLAHYWGEAVGE